MAGTATLMALKADSEARSSEDRVASERAKAILVLAINHLAEYGYVEAAAALEREGGAPMTRYEAADNVDLLSIVREYEAYYELKLGKKPKLIRRIDPEAQGAGSKENSRRGRPGQSRPLKAPGAGQGAGIPAAPLKADGLTAAQTEKYMAAAAQAGVSSQQLRGVQSKLGADGDGAETGSLEGITGSAMRVADRREQRAPPPPESIEERLLKPLPFAGDPGHNKRPSLLNQ